ncbi:MAG: DUF2182 domain-containing protein [Ilumatobacteraceae bacterium]
MVYQSSSPDIQIVDRSILRYIVPIVLISAAALGWWWSLRMSGEMRADGMTGMSMSTKSAMSAGGFLVAWLAMMIAMMLPAMTPVVKLYALASGQGRVAPLSFFVGGYLAVWLLLGVPAYFAWRGLNMPMADGADWVARLAGGSFVAAGVWQLTPLKKMCLKNCRSPMSFFLRYGGQIKRPLGASRMGATHGLFCVGCCWAMFVVLVAVGTMNIGWMLILAALIVTEKTFRHGERVATVAAVAFLILGAVLLASPGTISVIT